MKRVRAASYNVIFIVLSLFLISLVVLDYTNNRPHNFLTGFVTFQIASSVNITSIGTPVRFDVLVTDAVDLAGIQLNIAYNPAVLGYINVNEGSFLSNGAPTLFLNTINTSQPGLIRDISIVRIGSGINGNGRVLSINFNAINTGVSSINFSRILLSSSSGTPIIGPTLAHGNITVIPFVDRDGDGVPDHIDKCYTPGMTRAQVNLYGCPLPTFNKFSPELTSNFSDVDLVNFTSFRIGIRNLGQIDFGNQDMRLLDTNNNSINLDNIIDFRPLRVIVNSNLFRGLNKSATVNIFNVTNISNPVIKRDGFHCIDCDIISFRAGNVSFSIPHFTEYTIDEGSYCGDTFCSSQESCS